MKQGILLLGIFTIAPFFLLAQNVGISQPNPQAKLHITHSAGNTLLLDNTQNLNIGVDNALFFRTGSWYTGGIKTIGESSSGARLGFFTKAHLFDSQLQERLTITNDGRVGINTQSPGTTLGVNGSLAVSGISTLDSLKITGGQPGAGKLLTSDAQGNAFWKKPNEGMAGKLIIPAMAFTSNLSYSNIFLFKNGYPGTGFINNTIDDYHLMAPVNLPENAIVKKVTLVSYLNEAKIKGVWISMHYSDLNNGAITSTKITDFLNSDTENPVIQKASSPLLNHVVTNSNRAYFVYLRLYSTGVWAQDKSIVLWMEIEYQQ